MSQVGAKGRQTWLPSGVSGISTVLMARGMTRIVPRTRDISGGDEISFTSITNSDPVQRIAEGPTVRRSRSWRSAARPRSVMVKRPPGP